MAKSLKLGTIHELNFKTINTKVEEKIGNYTFGRIRKRSEKKILVVRYVGRSDTNLRKEIIAQGLRDFKTPSGRQKYSHFEISHSKRMFAFYNICCKMGSN